MKVAGVIDSRGQSQDTEADFCMLCFQTRSICGWGTEEGLGLSQQHRSLLAATRTDITAHPRLRDQILWEGTVTPAYFHVQS